MFHQFKVFFRDFFSVETAPLLRDENPDGGFGKQTQEFSDFIDRLWHLLYIHTFSLPLKETHGTRQFKKRDDMTEWFINLYQATNFFPTYLYGELFEESNSEQLKHINASVFFHENTRPHHYDGKHHMHSILKELGLRAKEPENISPRINDEYNLFYLHFYSLLYYLTIRLNHEEYRQFLFTGFYESPQMLSLIARLIQLEDDYEVAHMYFNMHEDTVDLVEEMFAPVWPFIQDVEESIQSHIQHKHALESHQKELEAIRRRERLEYYAKDTITDTFTTDLQGTKEEQMEEDDS